MSDQYIGEIRMFGFSFVPLDWMACNGQLLPISEYEALYTLIGTTYGGNGTTTFGLPNLQSRIPIGQGQGPGLSNFTLGELNGSEQVTLTSNQLPMHTHLANANYNLGKKVDPAGNYWAEGNHGGRQQPTRSFATSTNATMNPFVVGFAGGIEPLSILQPYQCINFCIAVYGIFPTQG
jgi:microcystin-dependent protein